MHVRWPHINVRVFTVLVFVSLPLMAVAAVMVLGVGQAQLRDDYGLQLTQVAEHTASAIDAYVFRRVLDVAVIARSPIVRAAAARSSSMPADASTIRAADQAWIATPAAEAERLGITGEAASEYLRDIVTGDPAYREILLADREGRLVAASDLPTDYYQGDEAWWREAYADGLAGRHHVGDVTWDESSRSYALEIAVPVVPRDGGRLTGVLKIAADARELLAVPAGLRIGETGEAWLIRPDGSIVYSRVVPDPKSRFFAADLIRERTTATAGEASPQVGMHFTARASDGREYLVGLASSQLGLSYRNLNWLVAVTRAEDEMFEPMSSQLWRLLGVFASIGAVVLVIALWFSIRLAAPPIEPALHISQHPEVPRIDEE
ncbi:MAG: cache domain-containing protein [Acidobacteriota bacterium]